ncbi:MULTISPECIES: hypothetical protein [Bradyrhizobium]|uniref:hypothetical protein n=1 Tax=Bradyrhizobium TaxID=374 RepID=UPI001FCB9CCB|nr:MULTISPECIES: hypothetical protein [unclassified Bradyrhizobium]
MPSDRIDGTLRDILHHIDLAAEFATGLDREAFAADLRAVYAVTVFGDHFRGISASARGAEGEAPGDRMEADGGGGQCLSPQL